MVTSKTTPLILLIAMFLLLSGEVLGAAQENEILFTLQRGSASLLRVTGGTWLNLGPQPVAVKFQNSLRTDGESRGELKFPDGTVFRMRSSTVLTLLNGGAQLQVGEAWFQLSKQKKPFQVVTPTANCAVMGTTFDVNVDRFGKSIVRVYEGMVAVRANQDPRRRQIVLQRGMMTTVKDRTVTEDRLEKFDVKQLEQRVNDDWRTTSAAAARFGPGLPASAVEFGAMRKTPRATILYSGTTPPGKMPKAGIASAPGFSPYSALPPIRPELPTPLKPAFPELTVPPTAADVSGNVLDAEHGHDTGEEPNVRETMEFFENLRAGIIKHRAPRPGTPEARLAEERVAAGLSDEPTDHDTVSGNIPPSVAAMPGPANRAPLLPDQLRAGHGRPFAGSGPGPLGIQDQRQLRDEISRIEERVRVVDEKTRSRQEEIATLRQKGGLSADDGGASSQTQMPGPLVTSEIRDRIRVLQEGLLILREEHQKLMQREEDLRSRLR
ncbi:MAG: FecR family protein [Candidatus Ozemobacteraceae bacterium]